jgi:6-phosphogluconolactonase (cycloisomerase 2 family)
VILSRTTLSKPNLVRHTKHDEQIGSAAFRTRESTRRPSLKQVTSLRIITPVLALTLAAPVPYIYAQAADAHAVFVKTNSVDGNEIIAYSRAADGSLVERNHYGTGGRGSGGTIDPLGSQGSLTLSEDRSLLFAVNTSTGDLSIFRVSGANLELAQVVSTGGSAPVAVAQHGNLVYAINFAGNSNVVGFQLDENGRLVSIPNSIRYLSATNPAVEITFSLARKASLVAALRTTPASE